MLILLASLVTLAIWVVIWRLNRKLQQEELDGI